MPVAKTFTAKILTAKMPRAMKNAEVKSHQKCDRIVLGLWKYDLFSFSISKKNYNGKMRIWIKIHN